MTFEEIVSEIRQMSVQRHKELIAVIVEMLTENEAPERRSILEFEGVGKHLYDGIDAQDYVNRLRDEWDEQP